jgi:hypothetical protein
MHALRSSAALSVNVFDYWRTCDPGPLQYALDLRERITRVSFEEQFPTGLRGNPPNVDVLLTLEGNHYVAIESKFTEWLTPRDRTIDPKYFPRGLDLWTRENLPNCQALAETMKDDAPFKFLDVPQLLKHALGLARQKRSYEICYIYFDLNCPESEIHAGELARFAGLIGSEIRFRALTYQRLFTRLSQMMRADDAPYMDYLTARYSEN